MKSGRTTFSDDLPIYEIEHKLIAALKTDRRLIIRAPTGSGKSTQVPRMLVSHGADNGQIVVLQPRRIAARMLAARVAQEMGTRLGDEVGYQIRFEDRSTANTRIKYVTEGILLRHVLSNPSLDGIGTIIFDEFHERHIYGDVSLGRAVQIQRELRPDLQLIVMSATLDSDLLADYLAPCTTIESEGRMYPVSVEYLEKTPDPQKVPIWDLAVRELERVLPQQPHGDVLIFMPGAYEISRTINALRYSPTTKGCEILPLHGELPPQQQDAAVARYDRRKIVVSTNVAETSLTIDGITLVVDAGLARIARFDPNRGINTDRKSVV
jgi:ATP-dependent helicase HrpB